MLDLSQSNNPDKIVHSFQFQEGKSILPCIHLLLGKDEINKTIGRIAQDCRADECKMYADELAVLTMRYRQNRGIEQLYTDEVKACDAIQEDHGRAASCGCSECANRCKNASNRLAVIKECYKLAMRERETLTRDATALWARVAHIEALAIEKLTMKL